MFQAFPSHSITLLPFQSTLLTFPPLHYHFQHHRFSILRFSLYPVSVLSSPFLSVPCFCPPFSVSIHTLFLPAILRFYLYPVSILSFSVSAWQSAGQSCLSNITINRHIVLSHFTVHHRFLSVYKLVYLGS